MSNPIFIGSVLIETPGVYSIMVEGPELPPPEPPSDLITTPEELAEAIAAGESVINLGAGDFGALVVKKYGGPLTINGCEGSRFFSLWFEDCENLVLNGLSVDWMISEGQSAKVGANYFERIVGLEITGCNLTGELVPEGFPGAAHDTDVPWPEAGLVMVGYYAGTAIVMDDCRQVHIHRNRINGWMQGIHHGVRCDDVLIERNDIGNLRTTPIRGNADHLTIDRNALHNMRPYRYPDNSGGDHLDFVHMWISAGHPPVELVTITNNLMDAAGVGFAAIGVFLENNNQPNPGYLRQVVNGNTYLAGDTQALTFEDGELECIGNVLLAPETGPKWPSIIFRNCNMVARDNVLWDTSVYPELSLTHPDNTFVTRYATDEEINAARERALAIINGD